MKELGVAQIVFVLVIVGIFVSLGILDTWAESAGDGAIGIICRVILLIIKFVFGGILLFFGYIIWLFLSYIGLIVAATVGAIRKIFEGTWEPLPWYWGISMDALDWLNSLVIDWWYWLWPY